MPTVLSLFSGCGGLDYGFEAQGFDILAAIDNNEHAIATYNRNLRPAGICIDVNSSQFLELVRAIGSVDLLLGGFPCQGFSKSGPKRKDDPRNSLFNSMVKAACMCRPRVIIAENVDGILQNYNGSALHEIESAFANLGYKSDVRILDFAGYGVPQHRRRAIFIFTADGDPGALFPSPTHLSAQRDGEFKISQTLPLFADASMPPSAPVKDYLGDLPQHEDIKIDHVHIKKYPSTYDLVMSKIKQGQKLCDVRNAPTSVHSWDIPEAFGAVSEEERSILELVLVNRRHKKYGDVPNGNPLTLENISNLANQEKSKIADLIDSLVSKKYLKPKMWGWDMANATFNSGSFKRLAWDSPSPTVLTNFYSPRYFFHPLYNRPFTVREAARLQTFPDSFRFLESDSTDNSIKEAFRQIGNAVPPAFSTLLSCNVLNHLANEPRASFNSENQTLPSTAAA